MIYFKGAAFVVLHWRTRVGSSSGNYVIWRHMYKLYTGPNRTIT